MVITGHTSGIGKALYKKYGGIGLSKTTGFDISKDDIEPYQVGQLMMGLKLYRATRKYKADNYDDLEIYSKMAKELHKISIDKKE